MIRKIVQIDEEKCNGCGLCVNACHEGAIELVDGKARLVGDEYCDGLGDCLPECPTGAIEIIERTTKPYDEGAVARRKIVIEKENKKDEDILPCGCPGTAAKRIKRENTEKSNNKTVVNANDSFGSNMDSQLSQWPVQMKLINTRAPYLENAHLLIAADCTAYAYGNFHNDFIKGRITLIGCPKLDDNEYYKNKLTEMLSNHNIRSITVVRMEVPCCSGIVSAVKTAMLNSGNIVPYQEIVITTQGEIINQ